MIPGRLSAILAAALALAATAGMPREGAAGPLRSVAIVTSEEGGAYAEVASAIEAGLAAAGPGRPSLAVVALPAGDNNAARGLDADLIVAVGTRAARALAAAESRTPVIATLIPGSAFERLVREYPEATQAKRFSAVFVDQPLGRQMELVRQALPGRSRLGVVLGPDSQAQEKALAEAAATYGFRLALERITSGQELVPALSRVLGESDVLLAVPDPVVFNSGTVQSVLLTSYRHQNPMVGFSPSYVKAGALLAVFSSPAQLGRQVAEMLLRTGQGEALPPPQHPRYFSVYVNHHVARSLGLQMEPEDAIEQKLKRLEARR